MFLRVSQDLADDRALEGLIASRWSSQKAIAEYKDDLQRRRERYTNYAWILENWIRPLFEHPAFAAKLAFTTPEEFVELQLKSKEGKRTYTEFLALTDSASFITYIEKFLIPNLLFNYEKNYNQKLAEYKRSFDRFTIKDIELQSVDLIVTAQRYLDLVDRLPKDFAKSKAALSVYAKLENDIVEWRKHHDQAKTIKLQLKKEQWINDIIRVFSSKAELKGEVFTDEQAEQLKNTLATLWESTIELQQLTVLVAKRDLGSLSIFNLLSKCLWLSRLLPENLQLPIYSLVVIGAFCYQSYVYSDLSSKFTYNSDHLFNIPPALDAAVFAKMITKSGSIQSAIEQLTRDTNQLQQAIRHNCDGNSMVNEATSLIAGSSTACFFTNAVRASTLSSIITVGVQSLFANINVNGFLASCDEYIPWSIPIISLGGNIIGDLIKDTIKATIDVFAKRLIFRGFMGIHRSLYPLEPIPEHPGSALLGDLPSDDADASANSVALSHQ